jgi:hypothetical protein
MKPNTGFLNPRRSHRLNNDASEITTCNAWERGGVETPFEFGDIWKDLIAEA